MRLSISFLNDLDKIPSTHQYRLLELLKPANLMGRISLRRSTVNAATVATILPGNNYELLPPYHNNEDPDAYRMRVVATIEAGLRQDGLDYLELSENFLELSARATQAGNHQAALYYDYSAIDLMEQGYARNPRAMTIGGIRGLCLIPYFQAKFGVIESLIVLGRLQSAKKQCHFFCSLSFGYSLRYLSGPSWDFWMVRLGRYRVEVERLLEEQMAIKRRSKLYRLARLCGAGDSC
jgi:hypothetical protein